VNKTQQDSGMASKPVTLNVQPRGKQSTLPQATLTSPPNKRPGKPIPNLPKETKIYIQGSTADLYERIAAESKFSIHRLRITLPKGASIPNDKSVTVASTELQDGDTIQVKDLGKHTTPHAIHAQPH